MSKQTTNNNKSDSFSWWIISLIFILIIALWIIAPILLQIFIGDIEQRGLFGDSYGSLNSLFSGLAFAGVIVAILLQRKELRLQREELELTRVELARSAKAQEESGTYLGEQAQVMKVTAHLNGLAAIIQARTEQIEYLNLAQQKGHVGTQEKIDKLVEDRARNIEELESLMHAVLCAADY